MDDPALAKGVNTMAGKLTYQAVAEAHGMTFTLLADAGARAGPLFRYALCSPWAACLALSDGETLTTAHVTAIESARIAAM